MDNKILVALLIVGVILVGGYMVYNTGAIVSAQGTSTLKAQPDEVSVYLNIETRSLTAQGAKDANAEISDKVLTELLKLGLDKSEIQFSNYNIYPEYDWSNGQQKQKGYVASQQVVVKVKDFDKVAGIVDKSVDAGALVSYINFELSDEKQSEYKNQALENAGKDAQVKAEATARGLGKSLGRLVSVQSQNFNYPGPIAYYSRDMAAGGTPEKAVASLASLTPQDIEVSATIEVQYKLSIF